MPCYCGKPMEEKTSASGENYYSCSDRVWDNETRKAIGGCDFFFFTNDIDDDMRCACGELWIPVRQKQYAFCHNLKCKPHKLIRKNTRQPVWEEFELGEEFEPKNKKTDKKTNDKPKPEIKKINKPKFKK